MQRKYKMEYDEFRINFYGVIICAGFFTSIECIGSNVQPTSLIADFVQNFMKPYIESLSDKLLSDQKAVASYPKPFSSEEYQKKKIKTESPNPKKSFHFWSPSDKNTFTSKIKTAIRKTVTALKPSLQDEEHDFNTYFDRDETTIIEILPKTEHRQNLYALQTNVPNIYKYEKMKSDIKLALEKENVSDKTRRLVTKTLDELIAQVLRNKCSWRSMNISSAFFRSGKPSITPKEWEDLRTQYMDFIDKKQNNLSRALQVFNEFHKFFSNVINETQSMSGRLRFSCQVIGDDKKQVKRTGAACKDFKVCSNELSDFLQNVYDTINDTTVSVFRNYAAMYLRDVSVGDEHNAHSVPKVMEHTAKTMEKRVAKVYEQEMPKFKLDPKKDPEANIRILRNHVKHTVMHVLKHVKKHMPENLKPMDRKLIETVQKDLNMNLNVELGNQETDLKHRICAVFMTCNGRVSDSRRSMSRPNDNGVAQINPNSIYVKLQLNVDDKVKNDISDLFRGNKIIKEVKKNCTKRYTVTRTTAIQYTNRIYVLKTS